MDVVQILNPGKNGSKCLVERYQDDLLAVRHRLDPLQQNSYTPIERIIERKPAPGNGINRTVQRRYHYCQSIAVGMLRHETDLQRPARSAGAKWQPDRQVWLMRRGDAVKLGSSERIIEP